MAGTGPGLGQRAAGSTCTPRSTPRAGSPTPAAISTPPTATGTCCANRCGAAVPGPAAGARRRRRARRCGPRNGTPPGCPTRQALALMQADGADAGCAVRVRRRPSRRDVVGDDVTYVVNRNINFTNVCYTGCRFCAFAQRRTDADAFTLSLDEVGRPRRRGVGGRRHRGLPAGRDPPGPARHRVFRHRRRDPPRQPDLHIHAFSPMEIVNGASRTGLSIRDWLVKAREAGLDSIPGTAAEILDDDVRWILTKGKLPTAKWIEVVKTAHEVGLRSSLDDDVRARRHPRALGRAPAGAGRDPGRDRRFHRVRRAAVRPPELADLPGRGRLGRADAAGQPGGARDGPAAAARPDRQHPDVLGQARYRRLPGGAAGRGQRPRRHADGGNHLQNGRLAVRLGQVGRRPRGHRRLGRPARQRTTLYGEVSAERIAAAGAVPWVAVRGTGGLWHWRLGSGAAAEPVLLSIGRRG